MSSLSKIATAKMTGGGSNIRDGKYKMLVEKCELKKGHYGESFIAELRVVEATPNGEMQIAADERSVTDKAVVPNPVNTTCSLVCNLTKHDAAAGNVKKFVFGVLQAFGYAEEQITEEVLGQVISAAQPLRGMAVECETFRKNNAGRATAANAGKILVLQNWKPIAQTPDVVKQQRAWLDGNKATAEAPATAPQPAAQPAPATQPTAPAGGGLMSLMK